MRTNRLVYLAGPIAGNPYGCVRQALEYFDLIRARGLVPFAPQFHVIAEMVQERGREEWLKYDFEVIQQCAALIRLPGESPGADEEVVYANSLGIPVFTLPSDWSKLTSWSFEEEALSGD